MYGTRRVFALTLAAAFCISGCGNAEQREDQVAEPRSGEVHLPGAESEVDAGTMQLMMELQQIHQQLAPVRQEALQDPELAAELADVQNQAEGAMRAEHPELMERVDQVQDEIRSAQEAGDAERMAAIGAEARALEPDLRAAEQDVIARPDIRARADTFEASLRERMVEIEPESAALLDRADELQAELARQHAESGQL